MKMYAARFKPNHMKSKHRFRLSRPARATDRIVAKIDELMALCDQLKFRITQASQLQKKLADVVVEQAIAS